MANGTKKNYETITTKQLVNTFCEIAKNKDRRFCFVLGAGASRSSGIRTGAELAKIWLEEIKKNESLTEYKKFIKENKIDINYPGSSYPIIYQRRFRLDPATGFHYLNKEMESATPSYGYSVLAQMLADKHHNIIITTNFDNLTEEALYTYTPKRPLVCGHELLADFAKPSLTRPLIIKIHRDRFFNPQSLPDEIDTLSNPWINSLNNIFNNCIPIFIGYGGNDGSLMGFLEKIQKFDNLFWCEIKGSEISKRVKELLRNHSGKLVEIDGFDELMFLLQDEINLPLLDDNILTIAEERAKKYRDAVEGIRKSQSESKNEESKNAAARIITKAGDDWWAWHLKAKAEKDPQKGKLIYEEALKVFPGNLYLTGNYANLLTELGDYTNAEKNYKITLDSDTSDATTLNNYANLLTLINRNKEAENLFIKSLEIEPKNPIYLTNYAGFLFIIGKKENAIKYLELATKNKNALLYRDEIDIISLELYFYQYAYLDKKDESLKHIKEYICDNVRSLGFNLQKNVDKAIQDGHPEPELLQRLADIITKDAPVGDLCDGIKTEKTS